MAVALPKDFKPRQDQGVTYPQVALVGNRHEILALYTNIETTDADGKWMDDEPHPIVSPECWERYKERLEIRDDEEGDEELDFKIVSFDYYPGCPLETAERLIKLFVERAKEYPHVRTKIFKSGM
jgi:hypothetical protein